MAEGLYQNSNSFNRSSQPPPVDTGKKTECGTIRVLVNIGVSWDLTSSAPPVHIRRSSFRNCSSLLTSTLSQNEIQFPTFYTRPKWRHEMELKNFSCLPAIAMTEMYFDLSTDSVLTRVKQMLSDSLPSYKQATGAPNAWAGMPTQVFLLVVLKTNFLIVQKHGKILLLFVRLLLQAMIKGISEMEETFQQLLMK